VVLLLGRNHVTENGITQIQQKSVQGSNLGRIKLNYAIKEEKQRLHEI
jgi:hypothetical protein